MNPLIQTLRPTYFESVERQLRRIFYEILYAPLLAVIEKSNSQPTQIFNAAESALTEALQSGRIQYSSGVFSGEFNASLSKALRRIGCVFDARSRVYRIVPAIVPPWIIAEATAYGMKAKSAHDEMLRVLNETVSHLESLVRDHPVNSDRSIDAIEHGFKPAANQLAISPKLSEQAKAELKREYTKNMDLWVDKFSREEIVALRQRVEVNATQGYRFDRLTASIKQRYSVSENKAKFLARQETSLFLAKFREKRFGDAGIQRYQWVGNDDGNERDDHKALNGRVFFYKDPPVTNQSKGARNNPGQDYNCVPGDSRIDFVAGIEKGFRRWYAGELTLVSTDSGKTIRATPNHPVLTTHGWKPIGMLDNTDHLIELSEQGRASCELNGNQCIPMISEIFETLKESGLSFSFPGETRQFHGDGSNGNIDVVDAASFLSFDIQTHLCEFMRQIILTITNLFTFLLGRFFEHMASFFGWNQLVMDMAVHRKMPSLICRKASHPQIHRFTAPPDCNIGLQEPTTNNDTFKACTLGDGQLTLAGEVRFDDRFWINLQTVLGVVKRPVIRVERIPFSGHVYNLQSRYGYYTIDGVIVSNCRCRDKPVLEGLSR